MNINKKIGDCCKITYGFTMGGKNVYDSRHVNRSLIVDILDNNEYNGDVSFLYSFPLNSEQSIELFTQYNDAVQTATKFRKECIDKREESPYITAHQQNSHVIDIKSIGYFRGEIIAFRFENCDVPYIIFEYENKNFTLSIYLLRESYKLSNPNNAHKEGYRIFNDSKNGLKLDVIKIKGVKMTHHYHFTISCCPNNQKPYEKIDK